MELARTAKLPIVIHCRPSDNSEDAWDDCLRLMQQEWSSSGWAGSCIASQATLRKPSGRSTWDSWSRSPGMSPFRRHSRFATRAVELPLDRMVIETDSPFPGSCAYRGKRNEPAFVKEVARQLGELRGLSTRKSGPGPQRISTASFRFTKSATTV